jgi:AcrR family transcriptional regulator
VPKVRTPRAAWVDEALQAVAAGGPDSVRVEALAVALGVSKGGFYWHFADRQALLQEMLDTWEQAMVDDVIARVEDRATDPRAKVHHLFDLAPTADFAVELALRDWSRRDKDVATRLRRVEDDVEARSLLTYSLLIGSYFIASQHHGKTRKQTVQLAVDRLLREP